MKKLILLFMALSMSLVNLQSCDSGTGNTDGDTDPNSSPENVMNTIFTAAQTGEVGVLQFLLPPYDVDCDGDCIALCNPGNEKKREEIGHNFVSLEEFKEYFEKGKVVGTPSISGDVAEVNFVFGPNAERSETMIMQKIEGKWYLSSF